MKSFRRKSKSVFSLLLAFLMLCTLTFNAGALTSQNTENIQSSAEDSLNENFADNQILVTVDTSVSYQEPDYFTPEFFGLENVVSIEPLFEETRLAILDGAEHLADLAPTFNQIFTITFSIHDKENVLNALDTVLLNDKVVESGLNYYMEEEVIGQVVTETNESADETADADTFPLNDPGIPLSYYAYQHINLYDAWKTTTGSYDVKIGVMDSGAAAVSDLTLATGYNFTDSNTNTNDTYFHGTRVASVVAATGNNGVGISGVMQKGTIVPLKITNTSNSYLTASSLLAFNYANVNKIPVVNCSFGYWWSGPSTNRVNAINNYYGLVVFSSGNDGVDVTNGAAAGSQYAGYWYYTACEKADNKITVGGTNASMTNYGNYNPNYVDIAAPATGIYLVNNNGSVVTSQGTSYSAPMVAGVAGLMLSINPNLNGKQLRTLILDSATTVSSLTSYYKDGKILNAKAAVDAAVASLGTSVKVTGVSLNKTSTSLNVGSTDVLTATVSPSTATNKNVTWTSSNSNVASCVNGVITAKAAGTAVITVTTADGGYTASCTVTVSTPTVSVTGVSLNKSSTSLNVGGTETLTATVSPSNATNKNVTWTSSNSNVASCANGVITAKAAGTAVITVTTADGSYKATCTVTVNTPTVSVTGVSLNKSSTSLNVGGTETLTATVSPSNATNKNVTWTSSNSNIVSCANGVITAKAAGTAIITVTTADGGYTASCNVTVSTPTVSVTGVSLNKSSTALNVGGTETLTATVSPSNATNKNVTWTSSDSSVATCVNGVITAKAAGTAIITVTTADGGYTASCNVTVSTPTVSVTGVSLNKTSTALNVGGTETLTASITPSNATNQNITWTSSDSSIVTCVNGVITAKAAGTATITVTTADGGYKASCTVTVSIATVSVTGVSLDKSTVSLRTGETETLTASITPSNATNQNVTWTSSDSDIATCVNGIITAKAAGTATITVTTADGGYKATCTVEVLNAGPDKLTIESLTFDENISLGADLDITCQAAGGTGEYTYCYYILGQGEIECSVIYSEGDTITYAPIKAGTYKIRVYCIDSSGTKVVSQSQLNVA